MVRDAVGFYGTVVVERFAVVSEGDGRGVPPEPRCDELADGADFFRGVDVNGEPVVRLVPVPQNDAVLARMKTPLARLDVAVEVLTSLDT